MCPRVLPRAGGARARAAPDANFDMHAAVACLSLNASLPPLLSAILPRRIYGGRWLLWSPCCAPATSQPQQPSSAAARIAAWPSWERHLKLAWQVLPGLPALLSLHSCSVLQSRIRGGGCRDGSPAGRPAGCLPACLALLLQLQLPCLSFEAISLPLEQALATMATSAGAGREQAGAEESVAGWQDAAISLQPAQEVGQGRNGGGLGEQEEPPGGAGAATFQANLAHRYPCRQLLPVPAAGCKAASSSESAVRAPDAGH